MHDSINNIVFDDFIIKFYNTTTKINFQIDIFNDPITTIYDIHEFLLKLLISGINLLHINLIPSDLPFIINLLQSYFNNINIKLIINNYSKLDIVDYDFNYSNRFLKILSDDPDKFILNGSHIKQSNLNDIFSFYLIDTDNNLSVSFNYIN